MICTNTECTKYGKELSDDELVKKKMDGKLIEGKECKYCGLFVIREGLKGY